MSDNNIFYYPYASFTDAHLPLLKIAALYFDKLILLDPDRASWNTIGLAPEVASAVASLRSAGVLEVVSPTDVLARYGGDIAEGVRADLGDPQFLEMCERRGGRWTLALAKIPEDLVADQQMQQMLGHWARKVAGQAAYTLADYQEHRAAMAHLTGDGGGGGSPQLAELEQFAASGQGYDEMRGQLAYRYIDCPLAFGEALMMNHALYGALAVAGATPITDDPFHSSALALKLQRAAKLPEIAEVRQRRARQIKTDLLAISAIGDPQVALPVLHPQISVDDVLEYRHAHADALAAARAKLGWIAREIEAEPWTAEFARDLEHRSIPAVAKELDQARAVRDEWLSSPRGRLALKALGVATGAAGAVLTMLIAPLTPMALVAGALSFVAGSLVPGTETLLDWRDGKPSAPQNGLHYLLRPSPPS